MPLPEWLGERLGKQVKSDLLLVDVFYFIFLSIFFFFQPLSGVGAGRQGGATGLRSGGGAGRGGEGRGEREEIQECCASNLRDCNNNHTSVTGLVASIILSTVERKKHAWESKLY